MSAPPRVAEPPQLAPHYYRDNFFTLLDTVQARYGDLLTAAEHACIARLREAPFAAQCLYVRLVSRVGPRFREARLDYPEIGDCRAALEELLAAGLALRAEGLSVDEIGRLYTRDELARALDLDAARKGELLEAIAALELPEPELCARVEALDGARVVAPAHADAVALFQLLFFGNRHQNLTEFVLSDLGVANYYPYELDQSRRLFECREAVEEYLELAALGDAWRELQDAGTMEVRQSILPVPGRARPWKAEPEPAMDGAFWRSRSGENALPDRRKVLQDLGKQILDTPVRFSTSHSRRDRLCNSLARQLEREGELDLALRLYRDSQSHPARERAARVLERQGELAAALSAVESALEEPWCEEEADAMQRIATRLSRKLGGQGRPRPRDSFETLELALAWGDSGVELAAAEELAGTWAEVHYVENSLMNLLFGLAFWEQIFAPVPGAFHNPFQGVPADMYGPDFRRARRALLDARLAQLSQADLADELLGAYCRYRGYQCRWTDWRYIDEQLVATALAVVPGEHWLAIWGRMLFDPRENRRGFPDLLALGEGSGDYCLIEVKGPGDSLQDSQRRWLRFFAERGIPAALARVSRADG